MMMSGVCAQSFPLVCQVFRQKRAPANNGNSLRGLLRDFYDVVTEFDMLFNLHVIAM